MELELIMGAEMYIFIESGVSGGLSVISKRFAEANENYSS